MADTVESPTDRLPLRIVFDSAGRYPPISTIATPGNALRSNDPAAFPMQVSGGGATVHPCWQWRG